MPELRLRDLPLLARAGLSGCMLIILLGLWASLEHLEEHHQNRDGKPGVSLDDLRGAYHGSSVRAPLVVALERGHPDELAQDSAHSSVLQSADRAALQAWLAGDKLSEQYDNPDLGDKAPAEILARACSSCHARKATDGGGIGQKLPLEYWDDVKVLAYARDIPATPTSILVTSTHTHALSQATLTLVLSLLLWSTRFARGLRSALIGSAGIALLFDLGGWWLVRWNGELVWLLAAAGAAYVLSVVLAIGLILLELWLPRRAEEWRARQDSNL